MGLPCSNVFSVVVCCVLKVFKNMWKTNNSFLIISLPQHLLNCIVSFCFWAGSPGEGLSCLSLEPRIAQHRPELIAPDMLIKLWKLQRMVAVRTMTGRSISKEGY